MTRATAAGPLPRLATVAGPCVSWSWRSPGRAEGRWQDDQGDGRGPAPTTGHRRGPVRVVVVAIARAATEGRWQDDQGDGRGPAPRLATVAGACVSWSWRSPGRPRAVGRMTRATAAGPLPRLATVAGPCVSWSWRSPGRPRAVGRMTRATAAGPLCRVGGGGGFFAGHTSTRDGLAHRTFLRRKFSPPALCVFEGIATVRKAGKWQKTPVKKANPVNKPCIYQHRRINQKLPPIAPNLPPIAPKPAAGSERDRSGDGIGARGGIRPIRAQATGAIRRRVSRRLGD